MKVFLLGATGDSGYQVLKQLLSEGHQVKAMLRTPSKLNLNVFTSEQKEMVELVKGGVLEISNLLDHMAGCDAVISALGTGNSNKYTEIYSVGGRNILGAMRAHGIKKLITITAGLIDMSDPSTDNFFLNRIIRPNFNKVYYDQTRWETVLDDTKDIKWVCVRPPRLLNKKQTGKYRVQDQHSPKGGTKISRADVAHFIVNQLESDEYVHKKPVVAY
jgi:putative NADH-flavin reductase